MGTPKEFSNLVLLQILTFREDRISSNENNVLTEVGFSCSVELN
jgi:hypothetical protein